MIADETARDAAEDLDRDQVSVNLEDLKMSLVDMTERILKGIV